MNQKMDCRIIEDLLPLYIDGLTSTHTNHEIEAHLKECPACTQLLEHMKAPDEIAKVEEREIDFLKKIRKSMMKWKALTGFILIFLMLCSIAGYMLHNRMTPKLFAEVFGFTSREVYSCQIMDWSSTEKNPAPITIESHDLISIMKASDYYYEGLKDNYMYGNLYEIRFYDEDGIPIAHFWISDEEFLYTENSTYSIRNNPEIIEYLDKLFMEN